MDQLTFLKLNVLPTYRLEHYFAVGDIDTTYLLRKLKKQNNLSEDYLNSVSLLILRRKDIIADLLRNLFPISRLDQQNTIFGQTYRYVQQWQGFKEIVTTVNLDLLKHILQLIISEDVQTAKTLIMGLQKIAKKVVGRGQFKASFIQQELSLLKNSILSGNFIFIGRINKEKIIDTQTDTLHKIVSQNKQNDQLIDKTLPVMQMEEVNDKQSTPEPELDEAPFLEEQFPCSSFDLGIPEFNDNPVTFQEPPLLPLISHHIDSLEQTLYMNSSDQQECLVQMQKKDKLIPQLIDLIIKFYEPYQRLKFKFEADESLFRCCIFLKSLVAEDVGDTEEVARGKAFLQLLKKCAPLIYDQIRDYEYSHLLPDNLFKLSEVEIIVDEEKTFKNSYDKHIEKQIDWPQVTMVFCDNDEMQRSKYKYLNNSHMMALRLIEMTTQDYDVIINYIIEGKKETEWCLKSSAFYENVRVLTNIVDVILQSQGNVSISIELEENKTEQNFKGTILIERVGDPAKIIFSTHYLRGTKEEATLVSKLQLLQQVMILVFNKQRPDIRFFECVYTLIRRIRPHGDYKIVIDNYMRSLEQEREYQASLLKKKQQEEAQELSRKQMSQQQQDNRNQIRNNGNKQYNNYTTSKQPPPQPPPSHLQQQQSGQNNQRQQKPPQPQVQQNKSNPPQQQMNRQKQRNDDNNYNNGINNNNNQQQKSYQQQQNNYRKGNERNEYDNIFDDTREEGEIHPQQMLNKNNSNNINYQKSNNSHHQSNYNQSQQQQQQQASKKKKNKNQQKGQQMEYNQRPIQQQPSQYNQSQQGHQHQHHNQNQTQNLHHNHHQQSQQQSQQQQQQLSQQQQQQQQQQLQLSQQINQNFDPNMVVDAMFQKIALLMNHMQSSYQQNMMSIIDKVQNEKQVKRKRQSSSSEESDSSEESQSSESSSEQKKAKRRKRKQIFRKKVKK